MSTISLSKDDLNKCTYRQLCYYEIEVAKKIDNLVSKDSLDLLAEISGLHNHYNEIKQAKELVKPTIDPKASFPTCSSIGELLPVPTVEATAIKILALDLDEVLLTTSSVITSPDWIQLMISSNQTSAGRILKHFMEHGPKVLVEEEKVVQEVISKYRENGWKVIILTSRDILGLDLVIKQLADNKIPFSAENILMNKNLMGKRNTLFKWIQELPEYTTQIKIFVNFYDDYPPYLADVDTLNAFEGIKIRCCHFIKKRFPKPWTQDQLRAAVGQHSKYLSNKPIPTIENILTDPEFATLLKKYPAELTDEHLFQLL